MFLFFSSLSKYLVFYRNLIILAIIIIIIFIAVNMKIHDILHHEHKYKILICKEHQYAVCNLHDHLHDKHREIEIKKHCVIIKRYAECEILKSAKIQLLLSLELLILVLNQSVKTFQCNEKTCEFISINCKKILKHCNKIHD